MLTGQRANGLNESTVLVRKEIIENIKLALRALDLVRGPRQKAGFHILIL
jgi:hypothetical protein